jgi:phage tail sheath protein FI
MPIRHGIFVNEPVEGARAIVDVATAVIGLVATGPDADAESFPANQPVLVADVRSALNMAGEDGTLARSLAAIADQTSPIVIVSRVEETEDPADQEDAIIGTTAGGAYTGIQALLAARSQLGVQPRILGVPGLDSLPVAQALAAAAQRLNGMAYLACAEAADVSEAILYRDNFGTRESMLIWPDSSAGGGDAIARALGLRAKIDETTGWHKTLSNVEITGMTGLSVPVHWDLQDASTDAGLLNASEITTLIRKQGYRFWGNRTTSSEPKFAFESATRTAQVLRDSFADGLFWASDKPLDGHLIRDILETMNAKLRSLVVQGRLIGGSAWFDPSLNSAVNLANGIGVFDFDFTPCAPLEDMTINQRITDRYYQGLLAA